jgi:hypothetical protein
MARQEDACWRCGSQWVVEDAPPTTLHAIAGGRFVRPIGHARVAARAAEDRWTNEGGTFGLEPSSPLRAVAAGG